MLPESPTSFLKAWNERNNKENKNPTSCKASNTDSLVQIEGSAGSNSSLKNSSIEAKIIEDFAAYDRPLQMAQKPNLTKQLAKAADNVKSFAANFQKNIAASTKDHSSGR